MFTMLREYFYVLCIFICSILATCPNTNIFPVCTVLFCCATTCNDDLYTIYRKTHALPLFCRHGKIHAIKSRLKKTILSNLNSVKSETRAPRMYTTNKHTEQKPSVRGNPLCFSTIYCTVYCKYDVLPKTRREPNENIEKNDIWCFCANRVASLSFVNSQRKQHKPHTGNRKLHAKIPRSKTYVV